MNSVFSELTDTAQPVVNGILGGWQFNAIYLIQSGPPLRFTTPGATLGNGRKSRGATRAVQELLRD